MSRTYRFTTMCLALVGLILTNAVFAQAADDKDISFKRRSDDEKHFVERVGTAIVKAAHFSAKKPRLVKYEYTTPKANRTELAIKMEYQGAVSTMVTGKTYIADIVVKIDSTEKKNWEVVNIEYHDNNNLKRSYRKVQELIKELNK